MLDCTLSGSAWSSIRPLSLWAQPPCRPSLSSSILQYVQNLDAGKSKPGEAVACFNSTGQGSEAVNGQCRALLGKTAPSLENDTIAVLSNWVIGWLAPLRRRSSCLFSRASQWASLSHSLVAGKNRKPRSSNCHPHHPPAGVHGTQCGRILTPIPPIRLSRRILTPHPVHIISIHHLLWLYHNLFMKYNFKKSARSSSVWYYEFFAKYNAPHFEAKSKPPWPSMNALESWRPTLYLPISSACWTQILPHIFLTYFVHIYFFTLFLNIFLFAGRCFLKWNSDSPVSTPRWVKALPLAPSHPLLWAKFFAKNFIYRTCFHTHFF